MTKKVQVTIIIVVALVALILAGRLMILVKNPPLQRQSDLAKSKGNPQAKYKIVEYTDFQCPACAHGAQEVEKYLASQGQDVFLEYRPYPLTPTHEHAFRAAIFAECAARQGKFWPFHDLLFSRQKEWSAGTATEEKFKSIAREAGVAPETLAGCVADPKVAAVVLKMKEEGVSRGVQATPTYFVNGQMFVGVSRLLEALGAPGK